MKPITIEERRRNARRFCSIITRNGVAVMFAMWLMGGQNLKNKEIAKVAGLTDKPTAAALDILNEEGVVIRHNVTGWSLTAYGFDIVKTGNAASRRISDSLVVEESLINDHDSDQNLLLTTTESENLRLDELKQALDNEKIISPYREQLAGIPWLTSEHVIRWALIKKYETGENYTPRLLFFVLRQIGEIETPPPAWDSHPALIEYTEKIELEQRVAKKDQLDAWLDATGLEDALEDAIETIKTAKRSRPTYDQFYNLWIIDGETTDRGYAIKLASMNNYAALFWTGGPLDNITIAGLESKGKKAPAFYPNMTKALALMIGKALNKTISISWIHETKEH